MMKHPAEFRQKIKVPDEEIGELQEIQETSIIEPQYENIRIRNNTVSYSVLENETLLLRYGSVLLYYWNGFE